MRSMSTTEGITREEDEVVQTRGEGEEKDGLEEPEDEDEESSVWEEWSSIRNHPSVRACILRARRTEASNINAETKGNSGETEPEKRTSGGEDAGLHFGLSICSAPFQPFPWVSGVASGGAAEEAGLTAGDCLLCVCHTPLFGLSVKKVASAFVNAAQPSLGRHREVELLYWRPTCEESDRATTTFPAATRALDLSSIADIRRVLFKVDEIISSITCPVCFEKPIPKPTTQCTNGHLLCLRCRRRSTRCPICRTPLRTVSGIPLGGRCLLADQIRNTLGSSVDKLPRCSPEVRNAGGNRPASSELVRKEDSTVVQEARDSNTGVRREHSGAVVIAAPKHRGAKTLLRDFTTWLLESHRRDRNPPQRPAEPLAEGDIYRLCAAM